MSAETREPLVPIFAEGHDHGALQRQCADALGVQGGGMVMLLALALNEAILRLNELTADVDALKQSRATLGGGA